MQTYRCVCLFATVFSIVKIRPVLDFTETRGIKLNEASTMSFAYTRRKYKHVREKKNIPGERQIWESSSYWEFLENRPRENARSKR